MGASKEETAPTTFEEAAKLIGFGKFNILLISLTVFGIFSHMFEAGSVSYILAAAQCDLNLSLQQKGYLNSIIFAGMISGCFFWGFLLDVYGRQKLMTIGYLLAAGFNFLGSLSQSFDMLLFCKFFGGFIISCPFGAMSAYLSEFHSSEYRNKVQLINGTLASFAQVVAPLLAWGILPLPINWSLFDGNVELHSWNVFLMVTGLAPLIGGIIFMFLPESPKFLMTSGKNDEAMEILRTVYSWNTGNPPNTFPVKMLVEEKVKDNTNKNILEDIRGGFRTSLTLFRPPHLWKFLIITAAMTSCTCSLQCLRQWMPQLFQSIEDYKSIHHGNISDVCTMLSGLNVERRSNDACSTDVTKSMVYINAMIGATFQVVAYFLTGTIINLLGKKKMLIMLPGVSVLCTIGLLCLRGAAYVTIFTGVFIACGHVSAYMFMSVIVDSFPTSLRASALMITPAIGRLGIVGTNAIFPVLFKQSCNAAFMVIGGSMAVSGILSFWLPDTERKALQ
ncbi:synaptic vesicle glycoprotein 2B isoform X2 [Diabrotica virgifera virgifera]|uniref:Major facilitator superfamily (MFS) profile domain-containing protein n=1 Tax=Diabrotica virgifera virgifera TaxID=50390 RepID=A0ABM5KZG4_DIAVI|nr:synaptic vesicle glycoprotein 2B isoform X2 [Diabrotica virgifera virgifera]